MEQSRLQKFLAVAGELGVKGLAEDTMSQDNQACSVRNQVVDLCWL